MTSAWLYAEPATCLAKYMVMLQDLKQLVGRTIISKQSLDEARVAEAFSVMVFLLCGYGPNRYFLLILGACKN
ncbi:hypothetical protein BABINDRAFT_161826 [Babjeviella inositovora NRRL Y-12698]|uniref:Uncharacterized protein n=1 Tax=Babjeviella inositovora NRRL Y-12698 TaxID=984486 RepID=A0A1E3QP17_9ASCO|nr:uncharacterized protein BABINDRAFT_161826 [Babjeviella inositovora NRRL Y-12698]ODQ79425.1 hypothetical protein BABINDRAFT_161826 [Babjeviella inositovora NRRL Y-12698]